MLAVESQQLAEIESIWDKLPKFTQDALSYIASQIPQRSAEDIAFLRETRRIHLGPYRRLIKKESSTS
jgi:hypothetical protein